MVNLEQVKLLEAKVARAIEYVEQLAADNAALQKENAALQKDNAALLQKEQEMRAGLETNQQRVDELEILVTRFKEDQGQIEDGILAALDRFNQFESAIEKSLKEKQYKPQTGATPKVDAAPRAAKAPKAEAPPKTAASQAAAAAPVRPIATVEPEAEPAADAEDSFFETAGEEGGGTNKPPAGAGAPHKDSSARDEELDIF